LFVLLFAWQVFMHRVWPPSRNLQHPIGR
jgi:hypothetical protein